MHRSIIAILSITALLGMQTNAYSEYITVSGADGTYDLHAGEFSGLLGSTDNQFSMSELDLLAATLHGNGIDTIGQSQAECWFLNKTGSRVWIAPSLRYRHLLF